MSTKQEPGPFDGFERAAPNEPIFTLAAHDVLAAPLVREWVDRRRKAILAADLPDEKERLELIQCREAEDIADAMIEWVKGIKPAEVIADPVKAISYMDNETSAEEIAAKRAFDATKRAAQMIDNCVAELNDAAQLLVEEVGSGEMQDVAADIWRIVDHLKGFSTEITPKRPSYAHRT